MKNRILNISLVGLLLSLLSSCGIYSKYEPDRPEFIGSLYEPIASDSVSFDTISLSDMSWREFFSDSSLRYLIELGLDSNVDLKVARLRVEAAQATLKASRLAFAPSVGIDVQGGVSVNSSGSALTYSVGPSASWEIDIFGRLLNAKRGAAAALEQSQAYRQAVQTQLISSIANSYYTLLMLDEQLEISRRTHKNWKENVRTLSAMKRAGKTNEASVLLAKSNELNVESSVLDLEKQIRIQENSLCALLGVPPMEIRRGRLIDQEFTGYLSVGVPLQLLSRRPDVRQAEMNLAQAFYATNAARSEFYPKVTLNGTFGWTNGSGLNIINPSTWLLNAVGQLVAPLFNRGATKARVKIAQTQQQEALLMFRQSLLDAGTEVNNALIQWQTANKRIEVDKKQILNLQAAVWNTRLLMRNGLASYLEVLTSQQNLLQAELQAVTDKYEEIQGVISLYHALGGGSDME